MFLLILFLIYLATPHNLQDLSSPTKDWTQAIAMKAVSPNFWLLLLFSHSVVSNSLQPYGLQHARLPCPSLSAGVCLNSCPLSNAIQPSHPCHPLSSCPQSISASGSFPISGLFTSVGQRIGVSVSASVLPMNILGWFPLGSTGLTSSLSKGLSRVFSSTTIQKRQFFDAQPSLWSNSHIPTWLLEKL